MRSNHGCSWCIIGDVLGLTGTHIGCDTSQCGACTVMLNGAAVKSCTILAVQADGAEVLTIEGMGKRISCTPYRKGFGKNMACSVALHPGMIMAAHQLLQRNPNPSEAEIRWGLEGNLCRCTGYQHIVKAVQYAAGKLASK